jgi:trk system potassium uptake protein TrkA
MKIIIIGGGKTGYYLSRTLHGQKNKVVLIEEDEETCKRIAEDMEINIICGDGTDIRVLEDAGIRNADMIAAVTGSDDKNLIVCKIAKTNYQINKTIAKVNNPGNMDIFKALGITDTVCIPDIISDMVQNHQAG